MLCYYRKTLYFRESKFSRICHLDPLWLAHFCIVQLLSCNPVFDFGKSDHIKEGVAIQSCPCLPWPPMTYLFVNLLENYVSRIFSVLQYICYIHGCLGYSAGIIIFNHQVFSRYIRQYTVHVTPCMMHVSTHSMGSLCVWSFPFRTVLHWCMLLNDNNFYTPSDVLLSES